MVTYLIKVLVIWMLVSAIFTLVIWPKFATKLNDHYPVIHSNEQDNL